MAETTKWRKQESHRDERRIAPRREMVEGLLILAVLVLLAIVARLPTA